MSLALLCVVVFAWLFRPDALTAMTVYPPFAWAIPGLLLAMLGAQWRLRRPGLYVAVAWLLALLVLSEEPRSLVRSLLPQRPGGLIIVSMNCAGGSVEAARRAFEREPDVILLQESPALDQIKALAREFYGSSGEAAAGRESSVIVRGHVESLKDGGFYTAARVRFLRMFPLEVVSLRLQTPPVRFDLWNPEAWRVMRAHRMRQREQVRELNSYLDTVPGDVGIIVGGDFNAVQGDPAPGRLAPRLRDAFDTSGRGWGDTLLPGMPVVRIDQIWLNRHFRPLSTTARDARGSDHRMVICRAELAPPR
jgi:hypothetical protein